MRIYEVYTIITNFNATYRQPCAQSHLLRDPRHGCARQVATKFWTQNGEYAAEVEHGVGLCGPTEPVRVTLTIGSQCSPLSAAGKPAARAGPEPSPPRLDRWQRGGARGAY